VALRKRASGRKRLGRACRAGAVAWVIGLLPSAAVVACMPS
jgi:hypothetical protein